jgi:hypothetical protein
MKAMNRYVTDLRRWENMVTWENIVMLLNSWIELKLYQKIPEVLAHVGVKFQVTRSSQKTCNIGQNRIDAAENSK